MSGIVLEVESLEVELPVETRAEAQSGARMRAVFQEAFLKLADRLQKVAGARDASLQSLTLERLELSTLSPQALLGPGGADLLADALYRKLVRRTG